jgi:hypothetical protein
MTYSPETRFNIGNLNQSKCSFRDCINCGNIHFAYRHPSVTTTVHLCENHARTHGDALQNDINTNSCKYLYAISDYLMFYQ